MSEELIKEIERRVKQLMEGNSFSGHDYLHVQRVYNLAMHIGKIEGADELILRPAVLMHDLGRIDEARNPEIRHAEASIIYAKDILNEIDFPEQYKEPILHIIKYHSWKNTSEAKTIEHKVMQDSDKIDALGIIGIMRVYDFGGAKGRLDYHPVDPFLRTDRELDDTKYTLDHFYEKLFKLGMIMHTETGKKIAELRLTKMQNFLMDLEKELSGEA